MNPHLALLHRYPFERLRQLIAGIEPPTDLAPIALWIGEPRHSPPRFLIEALTAALGTLGQYPAALGLPELREAAAQWLERRFALPAGCVDPQTMLLPVSGTREALFSFVQASVDPADAPLVLMPNPFYQIYEGAALLAAALLLRLPSRTTRRAPHVRTVVAASLGLTTAGTAVPETWVGLWIALAVLAAALWLLLRFAGGPGWTLTHTAAVGAGALLSRGALAFLYYPLVGETSAAQKYTHNVAMLLGVVAVCAFVLRRSRVRPE